MNELVYSNVSSNNWQLATDMDYEHYELKSWISGPMEYSRRIIEVLYYMNQHKYLILSSRMKKLKASA